MEKRKDNKNFWIIAIVAIIALVFVFGSSGITGKPLFKAGTYDPIVAHSCDADSRCEVNDRIWAPNTLKLTSQDGKVKIEGDLTLTKLGQIKGTVFETSDIHGLTITPKPDFAYIKGNVIIGDPPIFDFEEDTIGNVAIERELQVHGLSNFRNAFFIDDAGGNFIHVDASKELGPLVITTWRSSGSGYVCVDFFGRLYRSETPCVLD